MRNYVIINGVNSLTINGLAINELPPISKPPMRNLIEEIDGRDGDIVTNLGYGAYDKVMTIGLFHTFDINQVIAFFNGSGTIVFSNEPDKVYNFTILEQIDYEKLINFKTATVTLHCQPFKYPTEETPIEITPTFIEEEGEELTLNDTEYAPMQVNLKGNTSQASEPTPDSPVDVNVVSGDNTLKINNSNFFDGVMELGSINSSGTKLPSDTNIRSKNYIPVEENTDYILSTTLSASGYTRNFIWFYDENYTKIGSSTKANGSYFTTIEGTKYVLFRPDYATNDLTLKFWINKGQTSLPYQEYQTPQTQLISLGSIELCKISTYQDYIYKSNNIWYLHKEIGKVVLDGSEDWSSTSSVASGTSRFYTTISTLINSGTSTDNIIYVLADKLKSIGWHDMYSQDTTTKNAISNYNSTNNFHYLMVRLDNTYASTTANFKIWLSTHNTIVYYVLATPTDTEITDTTLISQLNNLANVNSYEGQTNISQENNDKPFILGIKAMQNDSDKAVVNNTGNIYSKPTIDIEGNGIVAVYLNNNQIFSANVDGEVIIDSTNLEAYKPDGTLANRQITGNISNLKLPIGNTTIQVAGEYDKATITDYVRYL